MLDQHCVDAFLMSWFAAHLANKNSFIRDVFEAPNDSHLVGRGFCLGQFSGGELPSILVMARFYPWRRVPFG